MENDIIIAVMQKKDGFLVTISDSVGESDYEVKREFITGYMFRNNIHMTDDAICDMAVNMCLERHINRRDRESEKVTSKLISNMKHLRLHSSQYTVNNSGDTVLEIYQNRQTNPLEFYIHYN